MHSRFRPEHKTRRNTTSAILWGYLSVAALGVAAIARGISSSTAVRHSIKRVWRFLRNMNVDATLGMQGLCREAECLGQIMVVGLDWPEHPGSNFGADVARLSQGSARRTAERFPWPGRW